VSERWGKRRWGWPWVRGGEDDVERLLFGGERCLQAGGAKGRDGSARFVEGSARFVTRQVAVGSETVEFRGIGAGAGAQGGEDTWVLLLDDIEEIREVARLVSTGVSGEEEGGGGKGGEGRLIGLRLRGPSETGTNARGSACAVVEDEWMFAVFIETKGHGLEPRRVARQGGEDDVCGWQHAGAEAVWRAVR